MIIYATKHLYLLSTEARPIANKHFECNTYFSGERVSSLVVTKCHSLRNMTSRFQSPSAQPKSHCTQSIPMNWR